MGANLRKDKMTQFTTSLKSLQRSNILKDPQLNNYIDDKIKHYHPLYFHPIDVNDVTFSNYQLQISGILLDGRKINIYLQEIRPFFDVLVENPNDIEDIKLYSSQYKIIEAYPIKEFQLEKKKFVRLFFNSHHERKKMIVEVSKQYTTYSNDISNHYHKVAREYKLNFNDWNIIENYTTNDKINFYLSVNDFIHIDDYDDDQQQPEFIDSLLKDKRIILMTWDIETYTNSNTGRVPQPEYVEDEVFMICMTIHCLNDKKPLRKVCLVTQDTIKDDDWILIKCENQKELILKFGKCLSIIKPDIVVGFNDHQYDWPFILKKAKQLDIIVDFIKEITEKEISIELIDKYYIRKNNIKLTADNRSESYYLKIFGIICIDSRIAFRKIYPKATSSLKGFLELCNLDSKLDLSHIKLRKYYGDSKQNIIFPNTTQEQSIEQHKQNIYKIAKYCLVDALRCQELLLFRNVINDYFEISSIAYVSLSDAFFYAGGMKVCNLIAAHAYDRNILVNVMRDNNEIESGKYPGGMVLDPDKGIQKERPIICVDFASLYPSLMITYNLSPDKMVLSQELANRLIELGFNLHEINFMFNNKPVKAWSVRHDNNKSDYGIYPEILKILLQKRNKMKDEMKRIDKEINQLNKDEQQEQYKSLLYQYTYINSKQNALKIYMNSFYGETGYERSPFFIRELAGGVTSAGQYNLKLISKFVENKGHEIVYGDTDSLYLKLSQEQYKEINEKYQMYNTKEEYYSDLIKETIAQKDILCNQINDYLQQDNGTNYLKVAYEEVLFPAVYLGKKKYCGLKHINEPNFQQKKLFIRGIDIIKQGRSEFFSKIGNEIILKCLDINNDKSICDIVEEILRDNIETIIKDNNNNKQNIEMFIKSAAYKTNVNNIPVQTFIKRMIKKKKKYPETHLPEPGERFNYVIIKNINSEKIGDKMEYVETFMNNDNMMIDLLYYFKDTISLCARFINSEQQFQPKSNKLFLINDEDERVKKIDQHNQNKAEKYLEEYIKRIINQLSNNTIDKYIINNSNNNNKRKQENGYIYPNPKQIKLDNYFKK
jgi:DNA polymerase elongation subunit (family B)